jgi:hypothetical protein
MRFHVLTMNVSNWRTSFNGVVTQNYGPPSQFEDGPSSEVEFLNQNRFKAHGWLFSRQE